MKAAFFVFLTFILPTTVFSQEVSWFSAEGKNYHEVTGCKPGSILFYSQRGGGKLLKLYVLYHSL